jgi:hypothetical protein
MPSIGEVRPRENATLKARSPAAGGASSVLVQWGLALLVALLAALTGLELTGLVVVLVLMAALLAAALTGLLLLLLAGLLVRIALLLLTRLLVRIALLLLTRFLVRVVLVLLALALVRIVRVTHCIAPRMFASAPQDNAYRVFPFRSPRQRGNGFATMNAQAHFRNVEWNFLGPR